MRKITLFIVVFIFSQAGYAQKQTQYYPISLSENEGVAVPMNFYVAGVYDGRQFTDNIGTVQKGITNKPVLARFEKPFIEELTQYLTVAYPKRDNTYPVWVRINDLYISEYTDRDEETGFATAVMDVMVKRGDSLFIEGTFGGNVEGTGMDVTKKHAYRIKQALNKCLGLYEVALPEDKLNIPFVEGGNTNEVPLKPAAGVYSSYLDMVKGKPLDAENYYLSQNKDKYYIINKTNSEKCGNFYAYSDGKVVYLNVRRFTNESYYVKTERIANKYFIDKLAYDQNKAITQVIMFQLLGYAGGALARETTMPMLVDCNSGQPFFLSDSGIKAMLQPHPELLKEYKKSKQTPEDIKVVVQKYYDLHPVK